MLPIIIFTIHTATGAVVKIIYYNNSPSKWLCPKELFVLLWPIMSVIILIADIYRALDKADSYCLDHPDVLENLADKAKKTLTPRRKEVA